MLKVELHMHTADDPADLIPYTSVRTDRSCGGTGIRRACHHPARQTARSRGCELRGRSRHRAHSGHRTDDRWPPRPPPEFHLAADSVNSWTLPRLKAREPGGRDCAAPVLPGDELRGRLIRNADLFDAVEWNAMFTRPSTSTPARRWAERHGKPMVGNGDVHRLEMLGTTYSLVDAEPNAAAICEAIVAGRVRVVARPLSLFGATRLMADLDSGQLHPAPSPGVRPRNGASPGSDPGDESTQGGRAAMMLFPAT